jgi:perosamine synthetase
MDSTVVPFYVPWVTRADRKAVNNALKSRWLTGGPEAEKFEKAFAEYVGTKYAIAVNSCTSALHLAMRALDIKTGDEVIVPDLTFAATANAPIFCGAKPVFVDVDEKTFNISTKDVLEKITPKTKAIIPVHYGGQPCDMKELSEIADDHQISIVEDCAHSLGAKYRGQQTGTFGKMGCFSFYPTKIITTLEGGMITTNDLKINQRLRLLREHGMSQTAKQRESGKTWKYDVLDLGYNYRLTEAQAALGAKQLERIDAGIKLRIRAANYYTKQFNSTNPDLVTPYTAPNRSHIYHLYTIKIPKNTNGFDRDQVFEKLSDSGIQSSVHYTPLHMMTYYKQFLNGKSNFPVAEKICNEILSLPLYPTITRNTLTIVTAKILDAIKKR